jgi:hypothetical protein
VQWVGDQNYTSTSLNYVSYDNSGNQSVINSSTAIRKSGEVGNYTYECVVVIPAPDGQCSSIAGFAVQALYTRNDDTSNPSYRYISEWTVFLANYASSDNCGTISFTLQSGLFGGKLVTTPGGVLRPGDTFTAYMDFDTTQFNTMEYVLKGHSINSFSKAAKVFTSSTKASGAVSGTIPVLVIADPCESPSISPDPSCYYSFVDGSAIIQVMYHVTITALNGGSLRRRELVSKQAMYFQSMKVTPLEYVDSLSSASHFSARSIHVLYALFFVIIYNCLIMK